MIEKKERNLKQEASGLKKHNLYSIDISGSEIIPNRAFHVENSTMVKIMLDIITQLPLDQTYDITMTTATNNANLATLTFQVTFTDIDKNSLDELVKEGLMHLKK